MQDGQVANLNIPATTVMTQAASVSGENNNKFEYVPLINEQHNPFNYNNDNGAAYEEVLLAESEALITKLSMK